MLKVCCLCMNQESEWRNLTTISHSYFCSSSLQIILTTVYFTLTKCLPALTSYRITFPCYCSSECTVLLETWVTLVLPAPRGEVVVVSVLGARAGTRSWQKWELELEPPPQPWQHQRLGAAGSLLPAWLNPSFRNSVTIIQKNAKRSSLLEQIHQFSTWEN